MNEASLRIRINDRWLYLETPVLEERDEFMNVEGFDGDSEQCDGCGRDIQENGVLLADKLQVWCECGVTYGIEVL